MMHKLLLSLSLCLTYGIHLVFAQVGIGTENPDNSAILELQSTSQGFLMPRLTSAQRNAIENPAQGLMVFNLDLQCLQCNVGTAENPNWQCLTPSQPTTQATPILALNNLGSPSVVLVSNSGESVFDVVREYTFELEEDALVHINYVCGISDVLRNSTTGITDGRLYLMRTFFSVNNDTTLYGLNSVSYTNTVIFSSSITGTFFSSGNSYLELPAGTHTVRVEGNIFGGNVSGFTATFGSSFDQTQVVAYYQ